MSNAERSPAVMAVINDLESELSECWAAVGSLSNRIVRAQNNLAVLKRMLHECGFPLADDSMEVQNAASTPTYPDQLHKHPSSSSERTHEFKSIYGLELVMAFLDGRSLVRLGRTCKHMLNLAQNPYLWRKLCHELHPKALKRMLTNNHQKTRPVNSTTQEDNIHWKQMYIRLLRLEQNWTRGGFVHSIFPDKSKLPVNNQHPGIIPPVIPSNKELASARWGEKLNWMHLSGDSLFVCSDTVIEELDCQTFTSRGGVIRSQGSGKTSGNSTSWLDRRHIHFAVGNESIVVAATDRLSVYEKSALRGFKYTISDDNTPPNRVAIKGGLVVNGGWAGALSFYKEEDGKFLRKLLGHQNPIYSLYLGGGAGGAEKAATGSSDKTIRLWDTESGNSLGILRGHTKTVSGLQMVDDVMGKNWLVSCSRDGTVRLWDRNVASKWACVMILGGHVDAINFVHMHDTKVASAGSDRTVRVWDLRGGGIGGGCLFSLPHDSVVNCVLLDELRAFSGANELNVWKFDHEL